MAISDETLTRRRKAPSFGGDFFPLHKKEKAPKSL
jgi:hypothetical protein